MNREQSCSSIYENTRPVIWRAIRDLSCWYAQQINSTLLEMTVFPSLLKWAHLIVFWIRAMKVAFSGTCRVLTGPELQEPKPWPTTEITKILFETPSPPTRETPEVVRHETWATFWAQWGLSQKKREAQLNSACCWMGPISSINKLRTSTPFFNCTKIVKKIKLHILHVFQDQHQRSSCLHPRNGAHKDVSLRSQLGRIPSFHVIIYLSKSVLTIFSKVSSHLKRGLVTPHWRDLLYSFKPKYSFSSLAASSCFMHKQQKYKVF